VRWCPKEGLTFRFEFSAPLESLTADLGRRDVIPAGGAGSVRGIESAPEWLAETTDGGDLRLYSTISNTTDRRTTGTGENSSSRVISGTSAYASVSLPRESPLAFWYDTPTSDRLFCLGFEMSRWPRGERIEYEIDGTRYERMRASLQLAAEPPLELYRAEGEGE
jgi:hypothetical protein